MINGYIIKNIRIKHPVKINSRGDIITDDKFQLHGTYFPLYANKLKDDLRYIIKIIHTE
jgi:hypothetical protein